VEIQHINHHLIECWRKPIGPLALLAFPLRTSPESPNAKKNLRVEFEVKNIRLRPMADLRELGASENVS
jgi:hypothetical protein